MARNISVKTSLNYNNIEKKDKNFTYNNLERSNCYNCDFSGSIFDYVSFRGAHFKSCTFHKCNFKWAEFTGTNLKGSDFSNALFENVIFHSVNLEGVNFRGAEFKNTVFLYVDLEKAKNLNANNPGITVYDEMPELQISDSLESAVINAMKNDHVKKARVLDTKDGGLNLLSIMILLNHFDEDTLIKGLNMMAAQLDRDFYTLSYIIKYLYNCKANGTL